MPSNKQLNTTVFMEDHHVLRMNIMKEYYYIIL